LRKIECAGKRREEETDSSKQGLAGWTVGLGLFRTQNGGIDTHTHTLKDCVERRRPKEEDKKNTHKIHTHREKKARA
jgi:hypothetical protein